MAQMVENLPAVQETRVLSLGQEDALETGMATHSSVLAWRVPQTGACGLQCVGCKEAVTTERTRTHADAEMKKRGTARVSCTRHQQRAHSPPKPPLGWPHAPPGEGPSPAPAGVRSKGTCWSLFLPRAEAGA